MSDETTAELRARRSELIDQLADLNAQDASRDRHDSVYLELLRLDNLIRRRSRTDDDAEKAA